MLFVLSMPAALLAQSTIRGTVRDDSGTLLQGISVRVTGDTTIGAVTDESGNFILKMPSGKRQLTISSIGYQNKEVIVDSRTSISIILTSEKKNLDEVVITGYSREKKKDITGSVAVVDMKSLKSIPAGSAMQALQGQASGVNVVSSGVPGAPSTIAIRGINSFGDTQPLVLIDGVQSDMNTINSDDIESIQILKDAGAAAVYGVRGSNGVIVITTKKGKSGAPTLSYHGFYGRQMPEKGNALNLLNSPDYAKVYKEAYPSTVLFGNGIPDYMYGGTGGTGIASEGDPAVDPSKYVLDAANPLNNYIIQKVNKTGTDWYHAFYKPAPMTSHNITASGGTDKSNYLFSLGYINQQGVAIETFLKRYSARINTQYKIRDNIRIGENAYVFYSQNKEFDNQSDFNLITQLYQMMPIIPLYDIKGNYGGTFGGPELGSRYNPVAGLRSTANDRHHKWNIVGNAYGEIDFLKHFTARTSFGGTIDNQYAQSFYLAPYWNQVDFANPNAYSESSAYNSSYTWTNTVAYANQFRKHNLKVLVGSEAIKNYGRSVGGGSRNFFSTNFDYLVLSNGTSNVTNFSYAYENTLFSLFSRLDYSYNDRYLVSATLRRDGSSKFGSSKRYGTFPSFSAGWRVSNEDFMKGISWLNDLKIRGSYGVLGSQSNVNPSNSLTLFSGTFGSSYYDVTGSSNSIQRGFYQANIGNPFTGWEEDVITNVGFDATIFKKLSVSLEYYRKSVNGLLFTQPLLATAGGAAAPVINIGDIRNTGLDFSGRYTTNITGDLDMSISANLTTYKNTVIKIPGPGYFDAAEQQQLGTLVRNQEGRPVSSFFGYEVIGLFNSDDDVSKSPVQDGAAPGRFKYRDVNGDGEINTDDRDFIGNPNPDFTYGFNIGFQYKGFDLSSFFYGSQGNEIMNSLKINSDFFSTYLGGKSNRLLNAWTPGNTNTTIPKVETINSFSTAQVLNSYFIEDGSYLRMKSLMLGYSINALKLKRMGVTKARVYLQATNLFTITKYSGQDPELVGQSASFGIDWANYPGNFKNYVLGIDLSF